VTGGPEASGGAARPSEAVAPVDASVIICTWNNSRRLALTLEAMGRCVIPDGVRWEVVLVNNGSTDDTRAVARRLAETFPLVYVEEPRPGLSRAKNRGLRAAAGHLLVFADDDVTPCQEWIARYWTAYQERPVGYYFGGPIVSEYEGGPPDGELLRIAGHSIAGLDWGREGRALNESERLYPANWACPAAAIRAAGAFDPDLGLDSSLGKRRIGETFDMMDRLARLGLSPWYTPEARITHFVPRAKVTIDFMGQNAEAIGMYSVRAARPHSFLLRRPELKRWCEKPGMAIAGIPWPLYLRTVILGVRWLSARILGRTGYSDYLALRFCLGRIKGHREQLQKIATGRAPR
jgi:glucosyl-dolichyl phosphate glucuronosyltransferase